MFAIGRDRPTWMWTCHRRYHHVHDDESNDRSEDCPLCHFGVVRPLSATQRRWGEREREDGVRERERMGERKKERMG